MNESMEFHARAGSDPGLLLNRKQGRSQLKICGTVSKEKGFDKRVLEDTCKNIR